jgi:hypothetical protein
MSVSVVSGPRNQSDDFLKRFEQELQIEIGCVFNHASCATAMFTLDGAAGFSLGGWG